MPEPPFITAFAGIKLSGSNPVTPMIDLIPEVRCQSGFRDFCYLEITLIFGYPWLPRLP